jgi:hypothetical protein
MKGFRFKFQITLNVPLLHNNPHFQPHLPHLLPKKRKEKDNRLFLRTIVHVSCVFIWTSMYIYTYIRSRCIKTSFTPVKILNLPLPVMDSLMPYISLPVYALCECLFVTSCFWIDNLRLWSLPGFQLSNMLRLAPSLCNQLYLSALCILVFDNAAQA